MRTSRGSRSATPPVLPGTATLVLGGAATETVPAARAGRRLAALASADRNRRVNRQATAGLVLVSLLLTGCGWIGVQQNAAEPRPSGVRAVAPGRATVQRSGDGIMSTDRFQLAGDYRMDWTATDHGKFANAGCYHGINLEPGPDGRVSANVDHQQTKRGTTYIYGLRAGQYYFDASSGCAWTVSLVPV